MKHPRKTACKYPYVVEEESMFFRNSEERIRLAKYRLNKSPRQGKDFPKTLLKITNEKHKISLQNGEFFRNIIKSN